MVMYPRALQPINEMEHMLFIEFLASLIKAIAFFLI